MAVIPNGFIEATYVWTIAGSPREAVNVIGHAFAPSDTSTPAQIAESLYLRWTGALSAQQRSQFGFTRVDIAQSFGGAPVLGSFSGSVSGAGAGDASQINSAILVKKLTGSGGRANQGRMFVPGMTLESNIGVTGVIAAGTVTAIQTVMAQWRTNCLGAFAPSVQSYPMHILHTSASVAPTLITGLQVQTILGTQRRRMRP